MNLIQFFLYNEFTRFKGLNYSTYSCPKFFNDFCDFKLKCFYLVLFLELPRLRILYGLSFSPFSLFTIRAVWLDLTYFKSLSRNPSFYVYSVTDVGNFYKNPYLPFCCCCQAWLKLLFICLNWYYAFRDYNWLNWLLVTFLVPLPPPTGP